MRLSKKERQRVYDACDRLEVGINFYSCIALADALKVGSDPKLDNLVIKYNLFYHGRYRDRWYRDRWFDSYVEISDTSLILYLRDVRIILLLLFAEACEDVLC